jgi:uncharacterized protein
MDTTFITYSGKTIDLAAIQPEQINIRDITAGLSKLCRFSGQINKFYSVAQHSAMLSVIVPDNLKKVALLHDASEAYLQDIISPLKQMLGEPYKKIEHSFMDAIFDRFGLNIDLLPEIKQYEKELYRLESDTFRHGEKQRWIQWYEEAEVVWPPFWDYRMADTLFFLRYIELFDKETII